MVPSTQVRSEMSLISQRSKIASSPFELLLEAGEDRPDTVHAVPNEEQTFSALAHLVFPLSAGDRRCHKRHQGGLEVHPDALTSACQYRNCNEDRWQNSVNADVSYVCAGVSADRTGAICPSSYSGPFLILARSRSVAIEIP